ncbi:lysophosphatidic acid receptor 3-like [Montipora capricornis]|uniref:lysophosphatidic acid receptor 3-like n=1 Tax=Montipora capricornis TaxID=246305 RepID=UPI0035F12130
MTNFQMSNDSDPPNRTFNFDFFPSSVCITLLTVLGIEANAIVTLNALAIIVFLKEQRFHKSSIYLTISLAVADMFNVSNLIFSIFSLGNYCNIWTINYLSNPIEITGALFVYFPSVSLTNLTAISLERVHATFRPFMHRLIKKKMLGAAVVAVWLIAAVFTVIISLRIQFDVIWFNVEPEAGAYLTFLFCCPFVILVSYTSIAIKFYCGTRPQHHGAISRERKLTKTLFIVTVVSLTLLLPAMIVNLLVYVSPRLWESFETKSHKTRWLALYSVNFVYCANSFINPLLYAYKMPEFKRALLLLLRCRLRSEPVHVLPLNNL